MKKFLCIILITIAYGCHKVKILDNEPNIPVNSPSDSLLHFVVETIQNLPIEEFKAKIGSCDYPLEISINRPDSAYIGSVLFENLGEKKIDRNCLGEENCFIIDTGSALERVNSILFQILQLTDSSMTGQYACSHPQADYPGHSFKARKKETAEYVRMR